ncbi:MULTISPECIES: FAD-dependent tricarballylate dehydrogenase TcuA [Bradyrhizobium]|uniref:FAD-binding dehydrogenase n=3 Tax=Bradyrhizobium TaxID=374 RepID=A0AAE5X828_9BRAD|nr:MULTISPECIES: FAD-dependent tricarballylate dehydrogenase TcuA [Bradyrhizobium]MCG2629317.1 FAD-dependent tricarballylate dehydrogenase TcuA [Bradyrhizobium zhengyangense]MCG2644598.1 FAD-dependent tricarballylate dehydrogenase TcuA [Bradyrhizobium zhengyangense]MCG2670831.1 FAD-dependent tricarballylate dehydrogenase TcuA [Bradyrhizobium zhengyangense]MDN4984463.1 FAD-dependent tricarballylate dehydrogenase TcuA [Bradyrhizobium sp. WYCCWR 13022]MDN5002455.1 FAD-dependent tricarballylate de
MPREFDADVIVVGAGNAAACAAISASNNGATVLMLEAAPRDERGGNSTYTAGAMRYVFNGVEDVLSVVPDINPDTLANTDFGTYTEDQFFDDMFRVTQFRTDPDLCEILVKRSLPTLRWMREQGVRFQTSHGRQAYKVNGRFQFWGGLSVEVWGGGPGLVDMLLESAEGKGIQFLYETAAVSLINDNSGVVGVRVRHQGKERDLHSNAVILACGGFESNTEMRARYLGPNWDLAKVRGTRFNTGAGIQMALAIGAMPCGHWSGAHAVGWDQNAPAFGDLAVGDAYQKHSYPFGIMVNSRGQRFLDEGADFRNYTYAKYGREILAQPGQFAWQVFDAKVHHLLRDEYRIRQITKITSDTLEGLADQLEGVDRNAFLKTVAEFNASVRQDVPFNPNAKDGRSAESSPRKSHWANTIDTGPFEAYAVTCGVTFTFGGLKIDQSGQVQDTAGLPIPGLFAAGELVGGLFYHNYPGGTGLTSGAVFGKIAGESAAAAVAASKSRSAA